MFGAKEVKAVMTFTAFQSFFLREIMIVQLLYNSLSFIVNYSSAVVYSANIQKVIKI